MVPSFSLPNAKGNFEQLHWGDQDTRGLYCQLYCWIAAKPTGFYSRGTLSVLASQPPRQAVDSSVGFSILLHLWQWLKFRLLLFSALLPFIRIWWLGSLWKPIVHSASYGGAKIMLRKQFLTALDFIWKATPSWCFWRCHSSPQPDWQMSLPVVVFVPFL